MMRVTVAAVVLAAGIVHAQAPSPVAFEVASVRRNLSDDTEGVMRMPATGLVSITNASAKLLVPFAYEIPMNVERFLVVDASSSPLLRGDRPFASSLPRFDIQGKIPDGAAPGQQYTMLRALLAERFKLRAQKEKRPVPVYALRVARAGRLGSGLRPSTADCIEYRRERFKNPAAQEPRGSDGQPSCSTPPFPQNGVMTLRNAGPIAQLVIDIQGRLDRPIVDETGLSATFTWVLSWESAPDVAGGRGPAMVFTAIKDQLGLTLEPDTKPLEVLVIDSIEMPSEN
jgi:uncharacterized protein (TIGR03435 family)